MQLYLTDLKCCTARWKTHPETCAGWTGYNSQTGGRAPLHTKYPPWDFSREVEGRDREPHYTTWDALSLSHPTIEPGLGNRSFALLLLRSIDLKKKIAILSFSKRANAQPCKIWMGCYWPLGRAGSLSTGLKICWGPIAVSPTHKWNNTTSSCSQNLWLNSFPWKLWE